MPFYKISEEPGSYSEPIAMLESMRPNLSVQQTILVFCTALAALFPVDAQKQITEPTSVWGNLVSGPYQVGFRSYVELDYGRRDRLWSVERERCIAEFNELLRRSTNLPLHAPACDDLPPGKKELSSATRFRPVLVAMWYPALATSSRMQLRDYLDFSSPSKFSDFAVRLKQFSETTAKETVFGKRESSTTPAELLAFNELFRTQSHASRDAPTAPGRFPLVIYHPGAGGSFDENAILCEFLASHGYVVLSSAYQTSTRHVSNDIDGPPRSIRDMQFLLQVASKLPYVDITRVAGIGHSAGAQTFLQWVGEADCPLTAMVSLDTTLEYTPRNFPGHKELLQELEKKEKPTIPIMLFASTERHPDFTKFDSFLHRAPRYEITVPYLRHNEYISQGALRAALLDHNVAGQRSSLAKMRSSYDQICLAINRFFDLVLKSDEDVDTLLNQSDPTSSSSSLKMRYKAPR